MGTIRCYDTAMIRRLFRTLAGWCWAMYLVALIVWIVAIAVSFSTEIRGTMDIHFGDRNEWALRDGELHGSLRHFLCTRVSRGVDH